MGAQEPCDPRPGNLHGARGNRHGKRFSVSSQEDEEGGGRQLPWVPCGAALGHGKGIMMLGRVGCHVARAAKALPLASAVLDGLGMGLETRQRGEAAADVLIAWCLAAEAGARELTAALGRCGILCGSASCSQLVPLMSQNLFQIFSSCGAAVDANYRRSGAGWALCWQPGALSCRGGLQVSFPAALGELGISNKAPGL